MKISRLREKVAPERVPSGDVLDERVTRTYSVQLPFHEAVEVARGAGLTFILGPSFLLAVIVVTKGGNESRDRITNDTEYDGVGATIEPRLPPRGIVPRRTRRFGIVVRRKSTEAKTSP